MIQLFTGNETEFLINLTLTLVAGLAIGLERESRGKVAGTSTHAMVIAGAMLFTMLSIAINPEVPSHVAAAIVTGVGFLGAGIILREDGGKVINLTTAASIWFSAAIGMAVGFGWYGVAIISTVFSVAVPRVHSIIGMHKKSM